MQATPRVFATLDLGAATAASALIGRVDRRWRLLGALSAPATAPPTQLLEQLGARIATADPELAEAVGLVPEAVAELPQLVARSAAPRTLAVLAASERALAGLAPVVARSGWRWTGMSADRHDARAMTGLLLSPHVVAVLVAVGDPPGGDERSAVGLLGGLTAAAVGRRPELTVVLVGAVARARGRFGASAPVRTPEAQVGEAPPAAAAGEPRSEPPEALSGEERETTEPSAGDGAAVESVEPGEDELETDAPPTNEAPATPSEEPHGADRPDEGTSSPLERSPVAEGLAGRVIVGPTAAPGAPAWAGLTDLLAGLRRDDTDSRQAMARSLSGLAGALDRRLELFEVGIDGGIRAIAAPGGAAGAGNVTALAIADAGLVPPDLDDARLERVLGWSTVALDRHRLRDRLLELRSVPWAGVAGDGSRLRLAAARAAIGRLLELTPDLDTALPPDLVVVAGGAFAPVPGAATLLAVADVVRRPAPYQVAFDHARLLGPLGTIEDPAERDRLLADLAGDLLVPLGGVVMPAGLRSSRHPGTLTIAGPHGQAEVPLVPGTLERLDVPPGRSASVVLEAGDGVQLGRAGRRMRVDLAGGVGGLLVDLRDVPLRIPERRETRRELLLRWQETAWPGGPA